MREFFLTPEQAIKAEQLGFDENCIACYILDPKISTILQFNMLSNQYTLHPSLQGRVFVSKSILKWITGITNALLAPLREHALVWVEKKTGCFATVDWKEDEGNLFYFIKWKSPDDSGESGEYKTKDDADKALVDFVLDLAINKTKTLVKNK